MSSAKIWIARSLLAIALAIGLGWIPIQFYARSGLFSYLKLQKESERLRHDNLALHDANLRLRAELDEVAGDAAGQSLSRAAVERVARDDLGLVRTGEIVFSLEGATK